MIFMGQLSHPDAQRGTNFSKRRFLWLEGSDVVSILRYDLDGYFEHRIELQLAGARILWKSLRVKGWNCDFKKTPAHQTDHGAAVADEMEKIRNREIPIVWDGERGKFVRGRK